MSQMLYKEASCKTAKDIPTQPCAIHGGSFHTLTVAEGDTFEDDIASAHADGWHDTTPEALAAAKPKAKKATKPKTVKPKATK